MSDIARLSTALAGRYQIERELGRGGMATVYLARDVRHDRDVAIKVLHPDLGAALGAERFLAEIKTTAKLQHPHILPLLDSGEADGLLFYVMPMVTGESLRDRLARERQLSIPDSVRIAKEVAGALDYAHRHGVIHRDIKPENILLHDGQAIVADFGIALAVQEAGGSRMTQTGLSLGTPQYMSPEQAMGEKQIDARSDIYALGAVTYEMLAGEAPFTGASVQAIVAKVLVERPTPLRTSRDTIPAGVEHAVLTALAKLPADRYATAAEFATALTSMGEIPPGARADVRTSRAQRNRSRELIAVLAAIALISTGMAILGWLRPSEIVDDAVVRTGIDFPAGEQLYTGQQSTLAISPQGDRIAYVTQGPGGGLRTYVRRTSELAGHGTELGASNLAFSPDGKWIAFTHSQSNVIMKMSSDGGATITLGTSANNTVRGLAWMANDTIAVATANGLWAVSSAGGALTPLIVGDNGAAGAVISSLAAFPDGKSLMFVSGPSADATRLTLWSFATRKVVPINVAAGATLGYRDGSLLYVTNAGALMALPFDISRNRVTGDPIQVQDSIRVDAPTTSAYAALSTSGTLLYLNGQSTAVLTLAGGGHTSTIDEHPRGYGYPRYSPDGRKIAVMIAGAQTNDIHVLDLVAHTSTKLTTEGMNNVPEWSPDGTHVLFRSDRGGKRSIYWQPVDGSAGAEVLYQSDELVNEAVFSPDGSWLLLRTAPGGAHSADIFGLKLADKSLVPLVTGPAVEQMPRLSPDGKWLAYQSNESGVFEVYVRRFPGGSSATKVSEQGGTEPLWGHSGRALYYRTENGVVGVTVTTGPTFSIGERKLAVAGTYLSDPTHPDYDVSPDGSHFLMLKSPGTNATPLLVHNWGRELREKLAAGRR